MKTYWPGQCRPHGRGDTVVVLRECQAGKPLKVFLRGGGRTCDFKCSGQFEIILCPGIIETLGDVFRNSHKYIDNSFIFF